LGEHVRRGREGGRAIYEPDEQITARIEATIDTLINEFAEARASAIQNMGHRNWRCSANHLLTCAKDRAERRQAAEPIALITAKSRAACRRAIFREA
jgi:hypothetical protein